jgi:hypothetical protein
MRKIFAGILIVAFVASLSAGCCYCGAMNSIADAEAAVAQCNSKGTITNAPYETCSAVAYLSGAKEVVGDCDWCTALEWANKSKSMADAALAAPPRAVSPCLSMMD